MGRRDRDTPPALRRPGRQEADARRPASPPPGTDRTPPARPATASRRPWARKTTRDGRNGDAFRPTTGPALPCNAAPRPGHIVVRPTRLADRRRRPFRLRATRHRHHFPSFHLRRLFSLATLLMGPRRRPETAGLALDADVAPTHVAPLLKKPGPKGPGLVGRRGGVRRPRPARLALHSGLARRLADARPGPNMGPAPGPGRAVALFTAPSVGVLLPPVALFLGLKRPVPPQAMPSAVTPGRPTTNPSPFGLALETRDTTKPLMDAPLPVPVLPRPCGRPAGRQRLRLARPVRDKASLMRPPYVAPKPVDLPLGRPDDGTLATPVAPSQGPHPMALGLAMPPTCPSGHPARPAAGVAHATLALVGRGRPTGPATCKNAVRTGVTVVTTDPLVPAVCRPSHKGPPPPLPPRGPRARTHGLAYAVGPHPDKVVALTVDADVRPAGVVDQEDGPVAPSVDTTLAPVAAGEMAASVDVPDTRQEVPFVGRVRDAEVREPKGRVEGRDGPAPVFAPGVRDARFALRHDREEAAALPHPAVVGPVPQPPRPTARRTVTLRPTPAARPTGHNRRTVGPFAPRRRPDTMARPGDRAPPTDEETLPVVAARRDRDPTGPRDPATRVGPSPSRLFAPLPCPAPQTGLVASRPQPVGAPRHG